MRRPLPILEIILVAAVAVAFLFLVSINYRRQQAQTPRVPTYSSLDKSGGGYAAWYELLRREGLRVARFERRAAYLTDAIDTLVIAPNLLELVVRANNTRNTLGQMTDVDFDALRKWVKNGGHLVWVTDGTISRSTLDMPALDSAGAHGDEAVTLVPSSLSFGINRLSGRSDLRVRFDRSRHAAPIIGDDTGAVVATYRFGRGRITMVSDQSLFSNARLAKADNARLAYNVVAAYTPRNGSIAFDEWVHGFLSGDTWWSVLPAPMRAAAIMIGAALVLLIVGTALRFGPTAQPKEDAERTSAEYVASMAALLERGRAARKAVRDLVDTCIHDVALSVGMTDAAPVAAIASRLAGPPSGTRDAGATTRVPNAGDLLIELDRLRSYERPTPAELVRAAQLTTLLRKEYTRYGRIGFVGRRSPARRSA